MPLNYLIPNGSPGGDPGATSTGAYQRMMYLAAIYGTITSATGGAAAAVTPVLHVGVVETSTPFANPALTMGTAPQNAAAFSWTAGSNTSYGWARLGVYNGTAGAVAMNPSYYANFYNLRFLGVFTTEDASGGFYGGTLITSLLRFVGAPLGVGTIEAGHDYLIDHLDASVRRLASDILTEIASYYSRVWAIWENGLLDWKTPNLAETQWVVSTRETVALDLDASVVNSQERAVILYTDASSGLTAEQSYTSTDQRNPYVDDGRTKDNLVTQGAMTPATAYQLAQAVMADLGYGPVPAAGTVTLMGEQIVQHAQGLAVKAWEIRAGDNIT
ncbi:MAG: hypothetical protein KGL35_23295, partial [Bradyrhizobium sp.]|nr:hypothetical protein [Bradyrhizobium sp.]